MPPPPPPPPPRKPTFPMPRTPWARVGDCLSKKKGWPALLCTPLSSPTLELPRWQPLFEEKQAANISAGHSGCKVSQVPTVCARHIKPTGDSKLGVSWSH